MRRVLFLGLTTAAISLHAMDEEVKKELEALRQQVKELTTKVNQSNLENINKEIGALKKSTLGDHLKFDVDYRFTGDVLNYEHADGSESENGDFLSNRLILTGAYAPRDDLSFFLKLAYNKQFGDTANHSQSNTNPGYADFDWVVNENALDNDLKVKEAYFVYFGNMFDTVNYTASVGRRPSSGGLPAHLREGDSAQSPDAHVINVETDAASFKFDLDKLTGISGMYFKLCIGRGLSNAKSRFQMDGTDYAKDTTLDAPNIDMTAFIFQPWSDGQYTLRTDLYIARNMIGFDMSEYNQAYMNWKMGNGQMEDVMNAYNGVAQSGFQGLGDWMGGAATFTVDGIGFMISDFLDNTKLFASYAFSKTMPDNGSRMLGSSDDKTGHSWWLGAQFPCLLNEDARIGLEYNHGSKYWRPITYAEDTMAGSKIATRGNAYEVYYRVPLLGKVLSAELRYTYMDYEYTGSNAFFGDEGTPMKIDDIDPDAFNNPIKEASDLRAMIRYQY